MTGFGCRAVLAMLPAAYVAAPCRADEELIGLCAAFDALERRSAALLPGGATPIADDDARAAAQAPFEARQAELLERICATSAVTLLGVMARARTLALWAPDLADELAGKGSWDSRMIGALLRDLVAADSTESAARLGTAG